jgi:hypothetical protein
VLAGETVNIKSSAPFILALGQYVYPVDSVYTVTLTDTSVLVQGKVYEPPEKPFVPLPKPDRDKDFCDWVVRTPADSAMALLEAGGTPEQAKMLMDNFFRQFPKSDTFSVKFEDHVYRVTCRGNEMITWAPEGKREPKPDYKLILKWSFEEVCSHLEDGGLLFKCDGGAAYQRVEEWSPSLIRQLKGITEQTAVKIKYPEHIKRGSLPVYEGMRIKDRTQEIYLGSREVADVVEANRREAGHEK